MQVNLHPACAWTQKGPGSRLRPVVVVELYFCMNLSGILVTVRPDHLTEVVSALAGLPGVEVRQTDAATGRIVVVQEAPEVGAEMDSFMRIRALPHVLNVDLVCHYFGDEPPEAPGTPTPPHSGPKDPS